jgi:hypothetical protein
MLCIREASGLTLGLSQPELIAGFREFPYFLRDDTELVNGQKKTEAIPVIVRGSPYGSETSCFPRFLDNRFAVAVRLSALCATAIYPQEDSRYSFLLD